MQGLTYLPTYIVELGGQEKAADTTPIEAEPDAVEVLTLPARVDFRLKVLIVVDH
jgi:hypothetical protein